MNILRIYLDAKVRKNNACKQMLHIELKFHKSSSELFTFIFQ